MSVEIVSQKIRDALQTYPVLAQNFGGMFGWDEYHDTRLPGSFSYGGSQVAKDLSRVLNSTSFSSLIRSRRQLRHQDRLPRGLSAGDDQCIASFGKDWTLGGSTVAGVWKAHCGCKAVPWKTPHTELLSCIDAWASELNGCRRVGITGSSSLQKLPSESLGENAFCGNAVALSSGHFEPLPHMPYQISFSMELSAQAETPSCSDIQAAELSLREMLCALSKTAYNSASFGGASSASSACARTAAATIYHAAGLNDPDGCRMQINSDIVRHQQHRIVKGVRLQSASATTSDQSTFTVDVTVFPSFPLASLASSDVAAYSGTQKRLAGTIVQQIKVAESIGMLSSYFNAQSTAMSGQAIASPVERMSTFIAEDCGDDSKSPVVALIAISAGCLLVVFGAGAMFYRRHTAQHSSRGERLGSKPGVSSGAEIEIRSSTDERKVSTFNKLMLGPPPGVAVPPSKGMQGHAPPVPASERGNQLARIPPCRGTRL